MNESEEDEKQREKQIHKIINSQGIFCHLCGLSEDVLKTNILFDETYCKKNLCAKCFHKIKGVHCQNGHRHEDHFRKCLKFAHKVELPDQADRHYRRQKKIRSRSPYKEFDIELINTISYLTINRAPAERRISFDTVEGLMKQALAERKKQERRLDIQRRKTRKAIFISKQDNIKLQTGLETCGYNQTYDKGIALTLKAFEKQPEPELSEVSSSEAWQSSSDGYR